MKMMNTTGGRLQDANLRPGNNGQGSTLQLYEKGIIRHTS